MNTKNISNLTLLAGSLPAPSIVQLQEQMIGSPANDQAKTVWVGDKNPFFEKSEQGFPVLVVSTLKEK